jgi:hypothetical protein
MVTPTLNMHACMDVTSSNDDQHYNIINGNTVDLLRQSYFDKLSSLFHFVSQCESEYHFDSPSILFYLCPNISEAISRSFRTADVGSLVGAGAADEVVAGGTGVGDGTGVLAVGVEDDTVGAGGAAGVDAVLEDGELLVRAANGEVETLVVVVLVTADSNPLVSR